MTGDHDLLAKIGRMDLSHLITLKEGNAAVDECDRIVARLRAWSEAAPILSVAADLIFQNTPEPYASEKIAQASGANVVSFINGKSGDQK